MTNLLTHSPEMQAAAPALPAVSTKHIPAIDGIRGIAILLVMAFHYCEPLYNQGSTFSKIVYKSTHFGWCGVDLFFVLSGFLITGILYDAKGTKRYLTNFYIRRTLRIFPLYYGVLITFFVIIPLFFPYKNPTDLSVVAHQQALWLYYTNIETAFHGWVQNGDHINMSHFWSLAVEEQFYLIWPLLVLVTNRRTLIRICVILIIGALALRTWYAYGRHDILSPYVLTQCRIDALAWGAFAALAARGSGGKPAIVALSKWLLVAGLIAIGIIVIKFRYFSAGQPLVVTIGFLALGASFAAIVLLATTVSDKNWFGRICSNHLLRTTGKLAYGLYVFHYLIHPYIEKILPVFQHYLKYPLAATMYLIVGFTASYLISFLSWHLYEKHFLRLKDVWAPMPARSAAAIANNSRSTPISTL